MPLDPQRVRQLHAIKLKSLVASTLGANHAQALGQITGTDSGAFAVHDLENTADTAAVYLAEQKSESALGPALATAASAGANELHVFVPNMTDVTNILVRRAALFDFPITVWAVEGDKATPIKTTPGRAVEPPPPRVPGLVALLREAGADVSVEHGVITGEVRGLEIARICPDASVGAAPPSSTEQQYRIEVGVGAHDREAFGLLHASEPTVEAVRRIAELIRAHRSPGAEPHPFNRMAAPRWLRAILLDRPELVGAKRLTAATAPVPRTDVTDKAPAVSYGVDESDRPLIVVSSVGIDLDLVPFAADARAFLDDSAQLVVAVPQRDEHPLLTQLLTWLKPTNQLPSTQTEPALNAKAGATLVPLPNDWQTSLGTA